MLFSLLRCGKNVALSNQDYLNPCSDTRKGKRFLCIGAQTQEFVIK
jgi:hypothetical protein